MSDRKGSAATEDAPETASGPNLVVVYSLAALALVAAIGVAALIILPFFLRR